MKCFYRNETLHKSEPVGATSSETRRGGYNATSYRSPGFDAVIDSAVKEMNPARSTALYRRAYRILTEDAPAMWLYELRNAQGVSKRIHPTGMRPDAWWANRPTGPSARPVSRT
jgi:ABC-type transport system substrate-binding protein